MSEDWSKLRDIEPLADGRVRIEFAIALDELPRVTPQLARTAGCVTGWARFDRERGMPVADVEVAARVALTCQRCLAPLEWPVQCRDRVALVAGAAEADRVPEGLETLLAPDHRVSVRDLVEEELLLALPIVPLHAADDCAAVHEVRSVDRDTADQERHRPFERLDELLKRRP
ncbi:MAG: YceD family protein [Steroidobacteraceae bacterium]